MGKKTTTKSETSRTTNTQLKVPPLRLHCCSRQPNRSCCTISEELDAATQTKAGCDQVKLRRDLSAYTDISNQLRAKRKEMYEEDRCGTLKDQKALAMSVEVTKLKRSSDKLRLSVCEQLRALVNEIHHYLDTHQSSNSNSSEAEKNSTFSLELADKCTELLHSISITAIKEEIFEKKRLMSNVRLHNGKSAVYVALRSRWRVRPRSWS